MTDLRTLAEQADAVLVYSYGKPESDVDVKQAILALLDDVRRTGDDLAAAQSDHEWAVGRVAALEEGLRALPKAVADEAQHENRIPPAGWRVQAILKEKVDALLDPAPSEPSPDVEVESLGAKRERWPDPAPSELTKCATCGQVWPHVDNHDEHPFVAALPAEGEK